MSASFESVLLPAAGRLHCSTANGPLALGDVLVIHPCSLMGKKDLLLLDRCYALASGDLQSDHLGQGLFFLAMTVVPISA